MNLKKAKALEKAVNRAFHIYWQKQRHNLVSIFYTTIAAQT
jgi:hypothetical protein